MVYRNRSLSLSLCAHLGEFSDRKNRRALNQMLLVYRASLSLSPGYLYSLVIGFEVSRSKWY